MQKINIINGIIFFLFLIFSGTALSQEISSSELDSVIDEELQWIQEETLTTITGVSKYEQSPMDVPAMVSVLDLSDPAAQTKSDLPELLRTVPGVTVYRNQGDNPWYRVSIRGLNDNFFSARTLITIDGVPFFQPHGGGVDLSWLPLANIKQVEVIRGTFSTLYGANAFGGVINIITKKGTQKDDTGLKDDTVPKSETEAAIQVSGCENIDKSSEQAMAFTGMLAHKGKTGPISYHLSADMLTDDGYRQNHQSTPSFMGPQSEIGLFSDNLERDRGRFSWNMNIPAGLSFSGFYTIDDKGVLGMNDNIEDKILHTALSYSRAPTNKYDWLIRFYHNRFEEFMDSSETFRFAQDNPFPGAHLVSNPFYYDLSASTTGGEFQNRFKYSDALKLVFGADFRHEASKLDIRYPSKGERAFLGYSDQDVQDYGAYFQAEYIWQNKFRITPGIRYDYDSKAGSFVSGKLGAVYNLSATHSVYGVAGRGFRAPNFNERFINAFGKKGNDSLKPEKTWQFELGNKNRFFKNRMNTDICVFHTIADDYIVNNEEGNYLNSEGVNIWGAEAEWSWQIISNIYADAALTIIMGEHDNTGYDITRIPKHKWSIGAKYDNKNWNAGIHIRGEAHKYLGSSMDEEYIMAESYQVVDVSAGKQWPLGKGLLRLTLFADNLFDKRYIETWPGTVDNSGGRMEGLRIGLKSYIRF